MKELLSKIVGHKDGVPYGAFPPYPEGPGTVVHKDWTFSTKPDTDKGHGYVISSWNMDGQGHHGLHGMHVATHAGAKRLAYKAGLISYCILRSTIWWDVPTPLITEEDAKRRWEEFQPEPGTLDWYSKWFCENMEDLGSGPRHVKLWDSFHFWEREREFSGQSEGMWLQSIREQYQQVMEDKAEIEARIASGEQ